MRRLEVFGHASEEQVIEVTGKAPISMDWVEVNNGDESRPKLRSRVVVQETKRLHRNHSHEHFFSDISF